MRVAVFVNTLGLGGTEKAACRWAQGLRERGHDLWVLTLADGPRRVELENANIPVMLLDASSLRIADELRAQRPDVIHAHAPGFPHRGDVLGEALSFFGKKIPVVQTNVFGRLENPFEDQWTDFRLFISWTSSVQAARRSFQPLNKTFFRRASVAVYPLDPEEEPDPTTRIRFRQKYGVIEDEVLFGRLSRPEPNKWTDLPLEAFRRALRRNPRMKLLLREPPPTVAHMLATAPDRDRFLILKTTDDRDALRETLTALDVVVHTSSIGESFGYGIAEPMNLAKPVIVNSTPWADQAQIELVRHEECGFVAGTAATLADAMIVLAGDVEMRRKFGLAAQRHVRTLAHPEESLDRVEGALNAVIFGKDNPRQAEDLERSREAAEYLDTHQFGHTIRDQLALRPFHYRVRFHQWRKHALLPFLKQRSALK